MKKLPLKYLLLFVLYFRFNMETFSKPEFVDNFGDNGQFSRYIDDIKLSGSHITFSIHMIIPESHFETRNDYICFTNIIAPLWAKIDGKDVSFMLEGHARKYKFLNGAPIEMTEYIN